MSVDLDEIIRMAREAGFEMRRLPSILATNEYGEVNEELERFAALVAAAEREACEKACEEVARKYEERHRGCYPDGMVPAEMGADDCVEAIRARGVNG